MSDSMREALEAAFAADKSEDEGAEGVAETAPVEETPPAPVEGEAPAEPVAEETAPDEEKAAPAAEEKPAAAPVFEKPPASWKAGAKERWEELPAEARAEILRREREIDNGMRQAAEKSRFADNFARTVEPFQAIMAAEGVSDPLVAVQNLFQTAAQLRMGTPMQKAGIIAQLVNVYGVDIPMLDKVLTGQSDPADDPTAKLEQVLDARLRPFNDFIAQQQQQTQYQQQQLREGALSEIEKFAAGAEFFDELRGDMGDLIALATQRGRPLTLQQAYDIAASQHPEVSQILAQRRNAANVAPERKAAAAASVHGTPGSTGSAPPADDIRAHLLAAMQGRR